MGDVWGLQFGRLNSLRLLVSTFSRIEMGAPRKVSHVRARQLRGWKRSIVLSQLLRYRSAIEQLKGTEFLRLASICLYECLAKKRERGLNIELIAH